MVKQIHRTLTVRKHWGATIDTKWWHLGRTRSLLGQQHAIYSESVQGTAWKPRDLASRITYGSGAISTNTCL